MKSHGAIRGWLILLALAAACLHPPAVFSQGTAFTYQGNLAAGGGPASGIYDFEFTLYDAISNGNRIAGPLTNAGATVTSGLFTATLDFGAVFNGSNCWLQIAVRTNGADAFTPLSPLQALAPAPYAIYAANAASANALNGLAPGGGLSGAYSSAVALINASNQFGGSFAGNGSGLTNLSGGGNFMVIAPGSSTPAVQAALSLGTNVQFAPGLYTLTNLTLAENTHIWGYGAIIQFASGSSGFFIDQGTNTCGTVIEGLTLDGLSATNYSSGPPLITDVSANYGGLNIESAANARNRHGIRINGGGGNIVKDCTIRGFGGIGFMVVCSNDINSVRLPGHAVITGNSVYSNYFGGYLAVNSYDYPAFYNAPSSLWVPGISAEDQVVSGNYIFANGIGLAALSGNHDVTGNLISANYCSVYIGGGDNSAHGIIEANTINHSFYGVRCDSWLGREFFMGNAVLDDNYPLWVDGSDWVIFQNNLVSEASPGGLMVTNSTATPGMIVVFRDNTYQGTWSSLFANTIYYGGGSGTTYIYGNYSCTVTGDTDGSAASLIEDFGNAAALTNYNSTNLVTQTRWITNNYAVTPNDSVLFAWGTNEFITNLPNPPAGSMLTVIVKNGHGSAVITNTTATQFFTIPGVGSNNFVSLGGLTSPSNKWTGVFDGANW